MVEIRLLTNAETAAALRITTRHLARLVRDGTIVPVRLTPKGRPRFRAADVDKLTGTAA